MSIEEEIARALAEHDHNYDSDCGLDFGCTCGAIDEHKSADEHADHLAEVLSPLLNRVRAEAWDRCVGEMPIDLDWKNLYMDSNPYREQNSEGRQQ